MEEGKEEGLIPTQVDDQLEGNVVPEEIEVLLERVAKQDPESAIKIERYLAVQQTSHRGPMPSPEDLKQYSLTQSDLPERMMRMAEKSLDDKSRHHDKILELKEKEIELRVLEVSKEDEAHKRETTTQVVSLVLAFIVVLVCIVGAFFIALKGQKEVALLIGGTTVVGVVGAFLKNKSKSKDKGENS